MLELTHALFLRYMMAILQITSRGSALMPLRRQKLQPIFRKILMIAGLAALGLGAARAFSFITHEPLLAYGNNYDMIRVQACHQVWPAHGGPAPGEQYYRAPIEDYQYFQARGIGACFPSSELVFTTPVALVSRFAGVSGDDTEVSIRAFGLARTISLLGVFAALFGALCYWRLAASAGLLALFWLIVVTDPANLLYLNTFFTEFSALIFALLFVFAVSLGLATSRGTTLALVAGGAALGLALAKYQHFLLPAVLVLCAGILARALNRDSRRLLVICAAGAMLGAVVQLFWNAYYVPETFNRAHKTNLIFYSALPETRDTGWLLAALGLPEKCANMEGQSWYTPGIADSHPCPEVYDVSRFELLGAMVQRPGFGLRLLAGAAERTGDWISPILGQVEGQDMGRVTDFRHSLHSITSKLPTSVLIALPWISLAGILVVFTRSRAWASGDARFAACVSVLCGITALEVLYVSFAGEGFMDFAKHAHLYWTFLIGQAMFGLSLPLLNSWSPLHDET